MQDDILEVIQTEIATNVPNFKHFQEKKNQFLSHISTQSNTLTTQIVS